MRKLLFLTGLVMAAVFFIACGGNANASTSAPSTTSGDDGKTTVTIDGKKVEVDTFTAKHYNKVYIDGALVREAYICKTTKPLSASSFGKKKAEQVWRAIRINASEVGTVTVVYYEKGVEIIKDGQHWFYDGFQFTERYLRILSASESVLHPGVWEPVYAEIDYQGTFTFTFAYTGGCPDKEFIAFFDYQRQDLGITKIKDLIISTKEY